MCRAGTGIYFVPGYPSLCYLRVPVTIAQLENIVYTACLSVNGTCVHGKDTKL